MDDLVLANLQKLPIRGADAQGVRPNGVIACLVPKVGCEGSWTANLIRLWWMRKHNYDDLTRPLS